MSRISDKYAALGGSGGFLGAPTGPERANPDGVGRARDFARGVISWSPTSGAHEVHGAILAEWRRRGAEAGELGYPMSDELAARVGNGRFSLFQGGAIHWTPDEGARVLSAEQGGWLWAQAIPQLEAEAKGIHVLWSGPYPWLFSRYGWWLQRRVADKQRKPARRCHELGRDDIERLRVGAERETPLGTLVVRTGAGPPAYRWPGDVAPDWDIFTWELDRHTNEVWVRLAQDLRVFTATHRVPEGAHSVVTVGRAIGLREGKVVAASNYGRALMLAGAVIDQVMVFALNEIGIELCVSEAIDDKADARSWREVPYVARGLQLPVATLRGGPEIGPGPDEPPGRDDHAVAAGRLIAGETLPAADFAQVHPLLEAASADAAPARPVDRIALLRGRAADGELGHPEHVGALDPLRTLTLHPMWRRVLGFGYFDQDERLEPGERYEYRLTGFFPLEDLRDAVYSFHTVPAETMLPSEFYLGDLRLRLPMQSTVLSRPFGSAAGIPIHRRGLRLEPRPAYVWPFGHDVDWWLRHFVLVIDLPRPAHSVILELEEGHALRYETTTATGAAGPTAEVPAGRFARLTFESAVLQMRLAGHGVLFTVRIPSGQRGLVPVSITLPPVTYENTPRPAPPDSLTVANLQAPRPEPDPSRPLEVERRHQLGFALSWRPPRSALWPVDAPAQPLDAAAFQIEHLEQGPGSEWTPILPAENLSHGSRAGDPTERIHPGVDILAVYPERRMARAGADFVQHDVFEIPREGVRPSRPVPQPSSRHRYRIRAVDVLGRPSERWTESAAVRLEKHVPPPLPVGLEGEWPSEPSDTPRPGGVTARVFVRGAEDFDELLGLAELSDDERAAVAAARNVILLRWGWHEQQRSLDPYAHEFRVYVSPPLDSIRGEVTAVTELGAHRYQVSLTLDRPVELGAAEGVYLSMPRAFFVHTHTAGTHITADVEASTAQGGSEPPRPRLGPTLLKLRRAPGMTRPGVWQRRVQIHPVTRETRYRALLIDALTLSESQPSDTLWVGVSCADQEPYVADPRPGEAEPRSGNESAVVPVLCQGSFRERPTLVDTPLLTDVPELVTPEPSGATVRFSLDLSEALAHAGLSPGERVRVERVASASVMAAYGVLPGAQLVARVPRREPGEPAQVPAGFWGALHPDDRRAIVSALGEGASLPDRHLVYLAAAHPHADRLFEKATEPLALSAFRETLPREQSRYVYRVRRVNGADRLSSGAAVARMVVRVPSLSPPAAPLKESVEVSGGAVSVRLSVVPDETITHLLFFHRPIDPRAAPPQGGELLRLRNRRDLYPHRLANLIRLHTGDGIQLAEVKALGDADVERDERGVRRVSLRTRAEPGSMLQYWVCSVSRDGIPSTLVGPLRVVVPAEGGAR